MLTKRHFIAAVMAVGAVMIAPVSSQAEGEMKGPVLLTVTGAVMTPNRGAYDPDTDKFFGFNEVEFAKAAQFDFEALENLKTVKVRADFPKGGKVYEFEGPLLADVLSAAGAEGETITIQALDGYAVEIPAKEAIANGAVVALKRDGKHFGLGDFGPTQVVFPRADRSDLADMPDDNWVWSIFHIKVE